MPRPTLLRAALAASLLALAACGDPTGDPSPLAPSAAPRLALTTTAACLRTDAQFLQQQIATLFSDPALRREARTRETVVESQCGSATAQTYPAGTASATLLTAPAAAVMYTEWLLARRGQAGFVASDASLWTYVRRLFGYVGYTVPASSTGLEVTGFVKVCYSGTSCTIASPDSQKAVRIAANALSLQAGVPFLVTGQRVECTQFTGFTDYDLFGSCLQVSVDPKSTPSFQLKAPGTIVELCTTEHETPDYIHARRTDVFTGLTTTQGKLAQRSERGGGASSPVSFRRYATGLLDDKYCDDPFVPAATTTAAAFRHLGASLLALFRPAVAYAGHGGLGTLPGFVDEEFSVFGPLDGFAFNGDFEADAVGAFPASGHDEMRHGTWTLSTGPSPSRASVQTGAPLGTNFLRLDQGGGASASKDPLTFTGTLATPMAPQPGDGDRRIRLRLRAAIATSRAIDARFETLTSTGAVFATLVYRDGASAQKGTLVALHPAGATDTTQRVAVPWAQNVAQKLQLTVHFDVANAKATVTVSLVDGATLAHYALPISALPDLAAFRWVLAGRDGITVLSDDYQAFDAPIGLP